MNSRPLLASFLCASLVSLAPAAAHAQLSPAGLSAASQVATALNWQVEPVVTSVLGLRSDDEKAAEDLTAALRKAFAEREMSGGQELTLEEVILTLDCSSEQDTACMTEAGRALETERLVFGSLQASGGSFLLDIIVLDVTSGQVEAQATMPLDTDALSGGNVDATAVEVVNSLYPQSDMPIGPAPVATDDGSTDPNPDATREPNESPYVWGPYKPRPAWKKAGLGVSVAVTVAGIGVAIGGWWYYKIKHEDKVRAVMDELGDAAGADTLAYCKRYADEPAGAVSNTKRSYTCQSFLGGRTANIAGVATAVAGGVATVVFTTLMFVHKQDKKGKNAKRRHQFQLTGGPTRGGMVLGGTGRF